MKKLIAILIAIVCVVPFAASAEETTNYYTYNKGDIVNFYGNADEEAAREGGLETIVADDKGANAEFVKAWLLGAAYGRTIDTNIVRLDIKQTDAYAGYREKFAKYIPAEDATSYDYMYNWSDSEKGFAMPTIQDMIDMFGAVKTEGVDEYTFPHLNEATLLDRNGQAQSLLDELDNVFGVSSDCFESSRNGILLADRIGVTSTTTVGTPGAKYWIIKLTYDANDKVTDAKIVAVDWVDPPKAYTIVPMVYFNKSADCHQTTPPGEMCYICGDEYKWLTKGDHEGCTEYPKAKKEEECFKKVCYKCAGEEEGKFKYIIDKFGNPDYASCEVVPDGECSPITGQKSYILEFAIVAALCAISLLVVKRKDLFRTI